VFLPDDVERDVWITGGRLTFEPVAGAETIADRGFVLPGLVDAHCHPGIEPNGAVPTVEAAKALALIDRDAGVLTIRDAGSPIDYRELDDDPDMPRLIRAGRHLAPPKRYLPGIGIEVGSAELAAHAAEQAGAGNGWVKLVGDWIDRSTGDLSPTYDDATFADAVAAAHAAGARVAVHTFSEAALPGLIAAGVDSVEFRRALMGKHPKHLAVLDAAAALRTARCLGCLLMRARRNSSESAPAARATSSMKHSMYTAFWLVLTPRQGPTGTCVLRIAYSINRFGTV